VELTRILVRKIRESGGTVEVKDKKNGRKEKKTKKL
jgi:hypothetical protein